jgi:hypothetical protein
MPAPGSINIVPRGRARIAQVRGTSSYATGGYTLPAWLQEVIQGANSPPACLNEGAVIGKLSGTSLLQFVTAATGAEVTNATDQSGNVVSILVP